MSLTPPSSGAPQDAQPAAPHGGPPATPWGAAPPQGPYAVQPPPVPGAPTPVASRGSRPSWVAWTALGLSAVSFLVATSIGILYAADALSDGGAAAEEGLYYDAGLPAWGVVELSPTGQATERALTDSVEEALVSGIEAFDGTAEDLGDVFCEALAAPRKNSVGTCSAIVQDTESTVVLVFTDDEGSFLATMY